MLMYRWCWAFHLSSAALRHGWFSLSCLICKVTFSFHLQRLFKYLELYRIVQFPTVYYRTISYFILRYHRVSFCIVHYRILSYCPDSFLHLLNHEQVHHIIHHILYRMYALLYIFIFSCISYFDIFFYLFNSKKHSIPSGRQRKNVIVQACAVYMTINALSLDSHTKLSVNVKLMRNDKSNKGY